MSENSNRFAFGKNWADYLSRLSDTDLKRALNSFRDFTGLTNLDGRRFLDVGCGSGIHSWAAIQLGASEVLSFDYDADSVDTCIQLKAAKAPQAAHWKIFRGDILNAAFLTTLGTFDFVYAWGVLHHTGRMWKAIENTAGRVSPNGFLHLAIYNYHWTSPIWKMIKWIYCHSPGLLQKILLWLYAGEQYALLWVRQRGNPAAWLKNYNADRGMRWYNNLRDWLGGYPYEYASTESIEQFVSRLGLTLVRRIPNGGTGCSEFLFQRKGGE